MTEKEFGSFWHDWWWLFVKGWHVTEFTIVTILAAVSFYRFGWERLGKILVWSAVVGVLFACSDEIHQLFVPKRGGRVSDVMIDCGGVLFGIAFATLFLKKRLQKRISLSEAKRTSDRAPLENELEPDGQRLGT